MFKRTILKTSALHSTASKIQFSVQDVMVAYSSETVLQDISFIIKSGEFVGLVGQNGSGKTTLLRVLLGLLRPTKGEVERHNAHIGYVPQRGQLYNGIVPISALEVASLGSNGNKIKARQALETVGMGAMSQRNFSELSGGQQQRVVIAKALANNANVLVLDEPTTGVDSASQDEFYELLKRLHNEGRTVIMVSHDVDSVVKLATRIICLNRTVVYDGTPAQFDLEQHVRDQYNIHVHHKGRHA